MVASRVWREGLCRVGGEVLGGLRSSCGVLGERTRGVSFLQRGARDDVRDNQVCDNQHMRRGSGQTQEGCRELLMQLEGCGPQPGGRLVQRTTCRHLNGGLP